ILLPALNEEDGVEAVMKRITATLHRKGLSYSVYLLDGQSTDQTRAVATKLGAEVFVQSGHGKGSAFREVVPKIQDDFAVHLEADLFAACALRGIPILEIPIRYDRRIGEPNLHLKEGFRIALALLKKRLRSSLPRAVERRALWSRWFGPARESA